MKIPAVIPNAASSAVERGAATMVPELSSQTVTSAPALVPRTTLVYPWRSTPCVSTYPT
ncbi:hypothetical protein [Kribbella speibonae]|uniref:hypothetical protein n=1 Tax=Kribbella speibonae TaxID=1572660 RepID=UPI0013F3CC2D|nr:hypothetical protein [Kribbella speibonae]